MFKGVCGGHAGGVQGVRKGSSHLKSGQPHIHSSRPRSTSSEGYVRLSLPVTSRSMSDVHSLRPRFQSN